jgi:hypothetical protein
MVNRKIKRGAINEISKIVIAIIVLAILAFAAAVLFGGKGGEILDSIRNVFRFGGR